jgi:hypothetical protein
VRFSRENIFAWLINVKICWFLEYGLHTGCVISDGASYFGNFI